MSINYPVPPMNEQTWTGVDKYFGEHLLRPEEQFADVLAANAAAGLPAIDVSPVQGKFLHLLAKMSGAKRVLEIGTLGGYSTIWLAKALPSEGRVITLELEQRHAEVARRNFASVGVADRIEVIVGPALQTLSTLAQRGLNDVDFVFIDADKANTAEYFRRALTLCRPGAVIVADNVVRKGQVVDPHSSDASVVGMRQFMQAVAAEKRVDATGLQTVGIKGYDGFVIARVRD